MPFVFGYCRVSSRDQAERGNSLEVQQEVIRKHFDQHYASNYEWGGIYQDAAVSASVPFLERTIGGELNKRVRKGDIIVSVKLDRMFRSMRDMCNTLHVWKTGGVVAKLLDISLDTATPLGEMMLHMLAAFAQFERHRISERIKETRHLCKHKVDAARRPIDAPYGFKYTLPPGRPGCRKYMVPDPDERFWMGQIYDRYVNGQKSFWDIWQWLMQVKAPSRKGNLWHLSRVERAYKAEAKLRQQELVVLHHQEKKQLCLA